MQLNDAQSKNIRIEIFSAWGQSELVKNVNNWLTASNALLVGIEYSSRTGDHGSSYSCLIAYRPQ